MNDLHIKLSDDECRKVIRGNWSDDNSDNDAVG